MSCAANAKETHGMKKSKLFISETYADQVRPSPAAVRRVRLDASLLLRADAWCALA